VRLFVLIKSCGPRPHGIGGIPRESTWRTKDRFDALMKLAQFRMDHRKERRQLEWRVSLGLWLFLAAGNRRFRRAPDAKLKIPTIALLFLLLVVFLPRVVGVVELF